MRLVNLVMGADLPIAVWGRWWLYSCSRAALPAWLHEYNHHRPHTAIGGSAPFTRLTNLTDQYT